MDKVIKKALEDLRADDQNNFWDQMETRLNDPANADLSENPDDHIIRNSLQNVASTPPLGAWSLMEAELDSLDAAPELEDVMLDGKAYESLNQLEVNYNEEHWPLMEEKIEHAFSWRMRAVRYKVAELALLLLAFITVLQYWPEAKEIIPRIIHKNPLIEKSMAQVHATENTETQIAAVENTSAIQNPNQLATAEQIALNLRASILAGSYAGTRHAEIATKATTTSTEKSQITSFEIAMPQLAKISVTEVEKAEQRVFLAELITLNSEDISEVQIKEKSFPWLNLKLPKLQNTAFRIGMYGMGSIDFVDNGNTSLIETVPVKSGIGYGTGISLSWKTGRFELESGLGYFSKTFSPKNTNINIDQVSLSLRELAGNTWQETSYDIISIPVSLRFDIMQRAKWKFYVNTGASMNITPNVIYRYDQYFGGSGEAFANSLAPNASSNAGKRAEEFEANTNSKNIGITGYEPIGTNRNSFINLDLGFGVERSLNDRYALFFQSKYFHKLGNQELIGLENESTLFRSVHLKTGVRISLFQ